MSVLIKNKGIFFILIMILTFSCQGQVKNVYSKQKIQDESEADIIKNNIFHIQFDNAGELHKNLVSDQPHDHFIIQIEQGNIKFKENYKLLISNYGDRNDLTFTLTKVSKKEYTLEIIQETRHLTVDKFIFEKDKNNLLELISMEQIQSGNTIQICKYSMSRKKGNEINLIINSIDDPKCFNVKNK
ncbi:hypothetical protein A9G07_11785 [Gilliamella sp. wkB72]|uniref:hypothetical protein n=1 Tax=Gilliamella sp. wkB72 TaxID=3120265 RepID=UPI000810C670|nr:hypothetical protein [Gilliamella apicola]OCL18910.1 hypothetical protein A9G07_11785 [Gilliamella apicola]